MQNKYIINNNIMFFNVKLFPFDISLILRQVSMHSMGQTLFSSSPEAYFNHTVIILRDWFV